jgi:hypothetical protein
MGLCLQCQPLSRPSFYEKCLKPSGKLEGFKIAECGKGLTSAAVTCVLCALFLQGLLGDAQRQNLALNGRLESGEVLLKPKIDPSRQSFPETAADGIALFGFTVTTVEGTSGTPLRCIVRLHSEGSRRWLRASVCQPKLTNMIDHRQRAFFQVPHRRASTPPRAKQ